jgi:sugar phosphate permease
VLFGAGLGLGLAPLTSASTNAVPLNEVGMSSGLLNLARNIGGAFGIAIFSTLLANAISSNVLLVAQNSRILGNTPSIQAIATQLIILKADILSYEAVFRYASLAMIIGAFVALFFLRTTERTEEIPPEMLAEAHAGG